MCNNIAYIINSTIIGQISSRRHSSEEGALGELVRQLKRLAITDRERCDHLFLKYTSDHSGALSARHVVAMCRGHQIPVDESIAKLVRTPICNALIR